MRNDYRLKSLFTLVFILTTTLVFARTGTIEGLLMDGEYNETMPGAAVQVIGTTLGAITDMDGLYKIEQVPAGTYTVKFSYVSYAPITVEGVVVKAGESTRIDRTMKSNNVQLKDVVVVAQKRTDGDVALVGTIRSLPVVASGITSQFMRQTQDRDAGEAVKRIPGVSLMGDRFIVFRGLSQRYNTVWINGMSAPSSEADQRAFSFDVLPTGAVDNILISKTSSPENPADYAGGFVKIKTKSIAAQNSLSFLVGTGFDTKTTGGSYMQNPSGNLTFFGFNDGTLSIPAAAGADFTRLDPDTDAGRLEKIAKSFNTLWQPLKRTALPDLRLWVNHSKQLYKEGTRELSVISSLNFSNNVTVEAKDVTSWGVFDETLGHPVKQNENIQSISKESAKLSLLHNWLYRHSLNNSFEFRNFFNNISSNRSIERLKDKQDGNLFKGQELSFQRRMTYSGQFSGEHFITSDVQKMDWTVGYSYADKSEPDQKQYDYYWDNDKKEYYLPISTVYNFNRINITLHEHIASAAFNYSRKFNVWNRQPEIKAGALAEYKYRDFTNRWFAYFPSKPGDLLFYDKTPNEVMGGEFFNNNYGGIKMKEVTERSNNYTAQNTMIAGYLSASLPIAKWFNLTGGVRVEENIQRLDGFRQSTGSTPRPLTIENPNLYLFPSAIATFHINPKNQVRLAYSTAVNRPEFREIAPFAYYDFENDVTINGNSNLKDCKIQGLDLRYEYYPEGAGDMISGSLFYKDFRNMIELAQQGSTYPVTYLYTNVEKGYCYGVEIELRKRLAKAGFMSDFSVMLNASLIKSVVDYNTGFENRVRAMQGQSPYIVNAGLFYNNNKKGFMANLVYNVIGKRIVVNGDYSSVTPESPSMYTPDTYEMPRNVLDLNLAKTFGKMFEVRLSAKDLINQSFLMIQTYDNGYVAERQQMKQGRRFMLSLVLNL